jgi:hypothetical protein
MPLDQTSALGGLSSSFSAPIFTTRTSRRFNGVEMSFRPVGDGTLDFTPITQEQYFQPHLAPEKPQVSSPSFFEQEADISSPLSAHVQDETATLIAFG